MVLKLTHEDLAEMIGSCRPMVSKLIGDMIKKGPRLRRKACQFIPQAQGRNIDDGCVP